MIGKHMVGLYEKALEPGDWDTLFEKTKRAGFDFLEISIDETDERISRLDWGREELEKLRRASLDAGIPVQTMCLSAHRRFPFGSSDPEKRRKAHEILSKAVSFCQMAGIRVIQLAGYDVYYEPSTPESRRLFRNAMNWAAECAATRQVMLAMEIMDTEFINSISKHMAYEAMIQSPWFHVYPDIGNLSAWPENNVEAELRQGIHSIVSVHLKDTIAVTDSFPGKFRFVPFGSGNVDFRRCLAQLEHLGYKGPYLMEMWYVPGTDDVQTARDALSWMQRQFELGRDSV